MAKIHVNSTAASGGDGSEANPFQDLATAIPALNAGDTLVLTSTRANPFAAGSTLPPQLTVSVSNEVWISGASRIAASDWSNPSGDVWQANLASEPLHVYYDYKQDSLDGEFTGVDLTTTQVREALDRVGWTAEQIGGAWYGYLRRNTATPITPAAGEWSHTGGILRVNAGSGLDANVVSGLCEYVSTTQFDGLTIDSNSTVVTGGRIRTIHTPNAGGNRGYGVITTRGAGIENVEKQNIIAIDAGWHHAGYPDEPHTGTQRIYNSVAHGNGAGSSGRSFPFVAAYSTNSDANFESRNCVHVAYPKLDTSGQPVDTVTPGEMFVHHNSVGGLDGILHRRALLLDYSSRFGLASNGSISPYPVEDSHVVGLCASIFSGNYKRTVLDRRGEGVSNTAARVLPTSANVMELEDCLIYTGAFGLNYVGPVSNVDKITLRRCTIVVDGTVGNGAGIFTDSATAIADQIVLESCVFVNLSTCDAIVRALSPTVYNNGFRGIVSNGRNVFVGFDGLLRHNNSAVAPRDFNYWRANIRGGATDVDVPSSEISNTFFDAAAGDFRLRENALPRNTSPFAPAGQDVTGTWFLSRSDSGAYQFDSSPTDFEEIKNTQTRILQEIAEVQTEVLTIDQIERSGGLLELTKLSADEAARPGDEMAQAAASRQLVAAEVERTGGLLDQTKAAVDAAVVSGAIEYEGPVTEEGDLNRIIIGDDYLAANSRAFIWKITPVAGLTYQQCTCHFAASGSVGTGWNVTGTISEVTENSITKWQLSFDLTTSDTQNAAASQYDYTVELRGPSNENLTQLFGDVRLIDSQTNPPPA